MKDPRPGLNPCRLIALMRAAVKRCNLDLSGKVVLTEAASGAYVVTPVLAAMAGAEHVYALTRSTDHGTTEEVTGLTLELARLADTQDRIEIITQKSRHVISQADIVTNSGHLRPLDARVISWMKPTAVIPLMYESWELRPEDVDLVACRERGIKVVGTNERYADVDVFSFLGMMALKLLMDAGIAVYASRILLLCDNHFSPFIERGLVGAGAIVDTHENLATTDSEIVYDAILVALQPRSHLVLSTADAVTIAYCWPGAVVAQFWGDIDRYALSNARVPVWPSEAPAPGHMGILPSDIGPEPIVRLQAGGLKVGEIMATTDREGDDRVQCAVASGYGQLLTYQ